MPPKDISPEETQPLASSDAQSAKQPPSQSNTSNGSSNASTNTKPSYTANLKSPGKSMADRKKIPSSFYLTVVSVVGFLICSGFFQESTLHSIQQSISSTTQDIQRLVVYTQTLSASLSLPAEQRPPLTEYLVAAITTTCLLFCLYVLLIAPLLGGFWTGTRAKKHVMHRYMGLMYLVLYALAWTEFAWNYPQAQHSILPLCVALNGTCKTNTHICITYSRMQDAL